MHHKFSETDADPHNSHRGFLFSHVGWLCMKKHPQVLRKGRLIDVSDISSDPLLAFHIKYVRYISRLDKIIKSVIGIGFGLNYVSVLSSPPLYHLWYSIRIGGLPYGPI